MLLWVLLTWLPAEPQEAKFLKRKIPRASARGIFSNIAFHFIFEDYTITSTTCYQLFKNCYQTPESLEISGVFGSNF